MATSAVGAAKNQLYHAYYTDGERNRADDKAIGFSVTGVLATTATATQTPITSATVAAAADYPSAGLNTTTGAFTVPSNLAGLWEFGGQATFAASAGGGVREVNVFNSTTSTVLGSQIADGGANVAYTVGTNTVVRVAAGDVITFRCQQSSGGALVPSAIRFYGKFIGKTGGVGGSSL